MRTPWIGAALMVVCLRAYARADNAPAAKTYHVPFRQTQTRHILVRAKINGKGPFNFIIDTGAPALFVSTAVGRKLHLDADEKGWARLERFEIEGGVVVPKARTRVEDLFQLEGINGLGLAGVKLDGIIGYTILARYRLVLDFTKTKMEWTPLDFRPPAPLGLDGHGGAPGGLDFLGSAMKMLGLFLGKQPAPQIVLRGFLGIELADQPQGAVVKSVLANSSADKAGIAAGDRITRLQNRRVADSAALARLAAHFTAGQKLHLTIERGGATLNITLEPGDGL